MIRTSGSGWIRRAAAWLLALALLLGTAPPVPGTLGAGGPDSFVAADLCAVAGHVSDPAKTAGADHDCGGHCCVLSGKVLPPAPLSARPLGAVVAAPTAPAPSPAPAEPPFSVHPARAPPVLAA